MKLPTDEELKEIVAESQQVDAIKAFYVFAAVILVLLLSGIGKSIDQELGIHKQNKIVGAK